MFKGFLVKIIFANFIAKILWENGHNPLTPSALDQYTDTNSVIFFLRLHKKLQRYWTLVCGISKLRFLSLMCHRLDDDSFVTFHVILKKRKRNMT